MNTENTEAQKLKLEDLIAELGLKKSQFASEADISPTHLNRAIRGESISKAYAARILRTLANHGYNLKLSELDINIGR